MEIEKTHALQRIKRNFVSKTASRANNSTTDKMTAIQTILIADRQALTRSGVGAALKPLTECKIIAEAHDFITTIREIERYSPDILLFSPQVLGKNPTDVAVELSKISPYTKQVAILDERDTCCELTNRMPLSGGLMRFDELTIVREIISEVICGRPAFSNAYFAAANTRKPCESLTDREREIMAAILSGFTSRDIGIKLGISVKTVENHRTNLMRKLDVRSIATLSQWARTNQCIYGL